MSRTSNAIKNAYFGIIGKVLTMIVTFVLRTVFIYYLGNTYLGVSGLYSEVLSVLSFAELGFGSALTFAMYKPVAEDDRTKIVKLLDFYKTVYRIIAAIIAVFGICLIPFLHVIIKGADWLTIWELRIYFLFYLANTVISYFVTYKFSYLNALQKNYVSTNFDTIITIAIHSIQILGIVLTKSFMVYLIINTVILTISRGCIVIYLNKKYPILSEKPTEKLSKEERRPIFKEVEGLMVHQFASIAVHSTDNILISSMTKLGVLSVGLISNYNLLINSVLGFVKILFNSITSGFGNIVATASTERFYKSFRDMNFINFWIYGFCSIAFWILVPPFITLWIGKESLIDMVSFTLIIINVYLQGQSTIFNNARIAKGNFGKDSKWALVQAIVNLVVSMVGAYYLGLVGIYIGTIASRMVYVLFRPYSMYYFLFEKPVSEYYLRFTKYFFSTVFVAVITKFTTSKLLTNVTIISFIGACVIVGLIPNILFLLMYFKTEEYISFKDRVIAMIARRKN